MVNIHEILKGYGIEVPADKKADFDKAVTENYKTVAEVEAKKEKEAKEAQAKAEKDAAILNRYNAVCVDGNDKPVWFDGKELIIQTHTERGCTLSSAIAANMAKGYTLEESIQRAKNYVSGALSAMLDLGKGSGPLMHNYCFSRIES